MEKEARHNLVINGSGSASGGLYNKVEINGSGKVESDLECIDFRCNGHANIEGHIKAKLADINGVVSMTGDLKADNIKISGKTTVNGNLTGESIRLDGAVSSEGDCEAEKFVMRGMLNLDGLLNAGEIEVELYGNCKVKEIGGEHIRIREGHEVFNVIKRLFTNVTSKLTTDTIEGNDIHLEHTYAKVVRGDNITIGHGCEIEQVEYRETFHKDEGAKVKNYKKV